MKQFTFGALYDIHGIDEGFKLTKCPTPYKHMRSLFKVTVQGAIDLDGPVESNASVEIVTDGALKVYFSTVPMTTTALRTALILGQNELCSGFADACIWKIRRRFDRNVMEIMPVSDFVLFFY